MTEWYICDMCINVMCVCDMCECGCVFFDLGTLPFPHRLWECGGDKGKYQTIFLKTSSFQSMGLEPVASASSGNLLEMQILGAQTNWNRPAVLQHILQVILMHGEIYNHRSIKPRLSCQAHSSQLPAVKFCLLPTTPPSSDSLVYCGEILSVLKTVLNSFFSPLHLP